MEIPNVAKSEKKATFVVAAIITIVEVEAATNITDQSCTLVFKKLSKMSELNSMQIALTFSCVAQKAA